MIIAGSDEMAIDMLSGIAMGHFLRASKMPSHRITGARVSLLSCLYIARGIDPRIHRLA
jgi:hypothetical protein